MKPDVGVDLSFPPFPYSHLSLPFKSSQGLAKVAESCKLPSGMAELRRAFGCTEHLRRCTDNESDLWTRVTVKREHKTIEINVHLLFFIRCGAE